MIDYGFLAVAVCLGTYVALVFKEATMFIVEQYVFPEDNDDEDGMAT